MAIFCHQAYLSQQKPATSSTEKKPKTSAEGSPAATNPVVQGPNGSNSRAEGSPVDSIKPVAEASGSEHSDAKGSGAKGSGAKQSGAKESG